MPGIAAATFAKAIVPRAHLHVSFANRCSNACRRRWNEISVSVAAPSKARKYSSAGLFFREPRLSVDALFTSKAGISSLSSKDLRHCVLLRSLMERHEQFEFLSYYVPGAIRWLLSWFLMVYCFAIYVGVVRNRKWPHYFWHHMMMGLLLENCIQITWYASNFLPLIHYSGTFGLYYWARVGFIFILLLLECLRCALAGRYVNLPFISDAAYSTLEATIER